VKSFLIDADWLGQSVAWSTRIELALGTETLAITIDAPYHGDPAPDEPAGRLWGLWNFEVVEVFIGGIDQRYLELEFGPHGHYLALEFHGERKLVADDLAFAVHACRIEGEQWCCTAELPRRLLPPAPLRFNAYTISGVAPRTYCALYPQEGATPDFHRLSWFRALEV
jgi:hypothetical protein